MYKIIIVDDEPIAVQSMEYMLKKNFDNIRIVGAARSGKDAIEKAYEIYPDIILMDINMPGINGINAMKQIREKNKNVKFIVVSAFDYFDYAVEAVALGVVEYLLKPVKEAKLVETIQNVLQDIEHERKTMRQVLEHKERFEMVTPILETGFINSLCMFNENEEELHNYCNLFNFSIESGYVMIIEFGQKAKGEITNKIGAGVQGQKMYDEYKAIIKSNCKCIVGPVMLNRIIVYVIEEEKLDEYVQKSDAINLAQGIYNRIKNIYPDVYVGLGYFHTSILEARKSYHEALQCLQTLSITEDECQMLHVDDIVDKIEENELDYESMFEKGIYSIITKVDISEIQMAFDNIFTRMVQDERIDFKALKNRCVNLIVGFAKRWENAVGNYGNVLAQILQTDNPNEIHNICRNFIGEATRQISSARQKKISSTIEKADLYMEENYSKDISLEDIAKEVNLSSYYFSRFYKSETGINFSDKLISIRIDKAKRLLKESEVSVKEVSFMVGYSDPNYFSKLFKKVTGCTASEYKKLSGM